MQVPGRRFWHGCVCLNCSPWIESTNNVLHGSCLYPLLYIQYAKACVILKTALPSSWAWSTPQWDEGIGFFCAITSAFKDLGINCAWCYLKAIKMTVDSSCFRSFSWPNGGNEKLFVRYLSRKQWSSSETTSVLEWTFCSREKSSTGVRFYNPLDRKIRTSHNCRGSERAVSPSRLHAYDVGVPPSVTQETWQRLAFSSNIPPWWSELSCLFSKQRTRRRLFVPVKVKSVHRSHHVPWKPVVLWNLSVAWRVCNVESFYRLRA